MTDTIETKPLIVIEVKGGLVQEIYADPPVPRIFVVDHDQDQDPGVWVGEFAPAALADMDEDTRQAVERELTRQRLASTHHRDSDCTLDEDDCCAICHVFHGDPCPTCGGRGYHEPDCSDFAGVRSEGDQPKEAT